MRVDPLEHLSQKWHDCNKEKQALFRIINRLQAEMDELQRKHKIALDNAYEEGYEHGQIDARKMRRHRQNQP
jgi:hypothetical protein